ncbi:distal tail protein Dit [Eggerthella phage PMBT5]|uniref:Uncharacterized protein n=1 Tax=Eggerthella phage PMBT5 TaxID=2283015 RepID=A0A345MKD9_9CAUD|nr:distal tail protein Dit [Eggerthella phage PMBT5]AXH71802.1 distal tail protein [Eggerthella phage PMBT5]
MPKFDATINGISLASYGVEPNMATVPQPEAKTYQAEIPGRDGLLDYTDAYGVVRYENRTVTVEAYEIGDITARMEHRRAICSDMHGKTCTLELTTLPGYAFTGRCSVEYDEDGSQTVYTLSFDCEPYMSAGERTFYANCAGGVDLVFISGDKPVKPRIEVPRRSIIVFNGQQYEVEAGTWTFDGIVFKRGRNEVYINTYTEPGTTTWGDLESMTWEQIGWHHRQSDASGALVNVTDALQARPNKLVVDGKAVQAVTTGKNLCPVKSGTNYGVTATVNADGSITLNGTATNSGYITLDGGFYKDKVPIAGSLLQVGKKYCVSGSIASDVDVVFVTYSETGYVTSIFNSGTVPANDLYYGMFLYIYAGVEFTNTVIYPQVEQAEVATAWEPYTGGKPSPNPEYPQDVDVVDSPVSVQIAGKNLTPSTESDIEQKVLGTYSFEPNAITCAPNQTWHGAYVRFNRIIKAAGETFYMSFDETIPKVRVLVQCLDKDLSVIKSKKISGFWPYNSAYIGQDAVKSGSLSFFVPDDVPFIKVGLVFAALEDESVTASNIQLERGTVRTTYEPYNGQTISITLPPDHNYLASLPDGTRDELVLRSDGVAVLAERVGKRVFNGSEEWLLLSGVSYGFKLRDTTLSGDYRQLICDRYTVREFASTSETQGTTASPSSAPNLFCFRDTTIAQTVDAWKAKLAASNVTVYYALATATVRYSADNGTTWSTTDPAAGNSAIQLYKGTNNVWCTDASSPNVTLNYDTQERTRKQRVSELYWRKNQPQRRLTWGQLATHTWGEIGSKSVQEWYYSGTADVVENAYINYEIGDL